MYNSFSFFYRNKRVVLVHLQCLYKISIIYSVNKLYFRVKSYNSKIKWVKKIKSKNNSLGTF